MNGKTDIRPAAGSHMEAAMVLALGQAGGSAGLPSLGSGGPSAPPKQRELPRSNVIAGEVHSAAIGDALAAVARIVGRTLGPHGANALVRDEGGSHFATKDGYTVLQRITFVQETATMVLDHVRSVSRAMVRKVGDGSTSAVIMADSLYRSISSSEQIGRHPPGAVQAAILSLSDRLSSRIRLSARPLVGRDDVVAVATVAANNDPAAGRLIADAYELGGAEANVFVAIGGERTEIRREAGYRVMRGMAHECFANETGIDGASRTTCRLRDAAVMVFDGIVDQASFNGRIAPAMNECISRGQPFVLVAREYTGDVLQIVVEFKRRSPGVQILLLDHATATRRGAARLGDLAAVLGCRVARPEESSAEGAVGASAEVRSTGSETVFVLAGATEAAAARAEAIKDQILRVSGGDHTEAMGDELAELAARVRALLGSEVTISVGGATEQEKRTSQYLLDDAALAVAAARRSGVVEGLGLTAQRALREFSGPLLTGVRADIAERTRLPEGDAEELAAAVIAAVSEAYAAATLRVLGNARLDGRGILTRCLEDGLSYNVLTREFVSVSGADVINPADTDVEVLRGAASIVSLLAASDQTVLTRPAAGGGLD